MKFSSILAGAFATVVAAVPTESEKRGFQNSNNDNINGGNIDLNNVQNLGFDLNSVNNLNFGNSLFQYIFNINSQSLLLSPLLELSVGNNFDFSNQFGSLFENNGNNNNDLANLEQLILFSQLSAFSSIASTGALSGFDLQNLQLQQLQLGALGNSFGSFDLNSLVNSQAQALIAPVLAQQVIVL